MRKEKLIFGLVLLIGLSFYLVVNWNVDAGRLSSDVWGYQFLELQERFHYWQEIPPSYNQSELYLAFPLLYYLNPGLDGSLIGYHLLMIILISAIYLISGWVVYKLFKNWWLAILGALLMIVPRFIFPTRMGLLDIGVLRGQALVMPLYWLLSYYWITYGLASSRQNFFLAIIAGLAVYLYPPMGILTIGMFVAAALLVNWKSHWRRIGQFILIYLLVSLPFWINHWQNPNTGMVDEVIPLTREETDLQRQIIKEKFSGSGFLASIDIADIKRSLWDEGPLAVLALISLIVVWRRRNRLPSSQIKATLFTVYVSSLAILFALAVELANYLSVKNGGLPVFLDHLRPLRVVGYALAFQSVLALSLFKGRVTQVISVLIGLFLIASPLRFSAPLIRPVVRLLVPESLRLRYNLAPITISGEVKSYSNLVEAARWARANLPSEKTKIFVFSDEQRDFQFKVISHRNTNLTGKEGNLWVTSGFPNSRRWYEERQNYKTAVDSALNFQPILDFAHQLGMTHLLVPGGRYENLYLADKLEYQTVFQNPDYRILSL